MDVSSGKPWDAAFSWLPRKRPSRPNGPPTTARAAMPRPIFARKLRREWPDFRLGSISLAKLFSVPPTGGRGIAEVRPRLHSPDLIDCTRRAGICLDGALTVHAFRKSCGQNWADHLPLNVVREFMGHASISTTAEFYSTVSKDHADQARWLMEALTTGTVTTNDAEVTPGAENASNRRAS